MEVGKPTKMVPGGSESKRIQKVDTLEARILGDKKGLEEPPGKQNDPGWWDVDFH